MSHSYSYWKKRENDKGISVYTNNIARGSSITEAVFIRRIIYFWEKWKYKGEMFLTPNRFANPIGMTYHQFRKFVKLWENKEIIETESRGWPLKKWYILDEKKLAKYLNKLEEKGEKLQVTETNKISYRNQQDKVTETNNLYNKSKIRENNNAKSASREFDKRDSLFFGKQPKLSFFDKAASRLIKILVKKHKTPVKIYSRKKWSDEIQKLYNINKIPKKEIKEVIQWYSHHITDQFVPTIYRANHLRQKWIQLCDAMKRWKIDIGEEDPNELKTEFTKSPGGWKGIKFNED